MEAVTDIQTDVQMYHAIGDDTTWCLGVAWEKSHRVARVHHKSLVLLHYREIVHCQTELCPVGEHLAIATIRHQLLGKLRGEGERREKEKRKEGGEGGGEGREGEGEGRGGKGRGRGGEGEGRGGEGRGEGRGEEGGGRGKRRRGGVSGQFSFTTLRTPTWATTGLRLFMIMCIIAAAD